MEENSASSASSELARMLLILDFDETLVRTVEQPLAHPCDFSVDTLHIYKRPHVDEFINECSAFCDLAIWSGGSADYIEPAAMRLFERHLKPVFIWSRRRCTRKIDYQQGDEFYLKDLKKVRREGFDLSRVLIVEDQPRQVARNYGNAIYVSEFTGDLLDNELAQLASFIRSLNTCEDVRKVEKRNWRRNVSP